MDGSRPSPLPPFLFSNPPRKKSEWRGALSFGVAALLGGGSGPPVALARNRRVRRNPEPPRARLVLLRMLAKIGSDVVQ